MLHSFTYGHVANPGGNAHATKCKTGVPFVVQLDLILRFPVIIMMVIVVLLLIYDDDDNATGDSKNDGEDNDKQNDNSNHKSNDDELVN